jgi:hypothetical protein
MQCVAHLTNLLVIILSKLPLVSCIETMLQSSYAFFVHNFKKYLEFKKLAKTLETKRSNIIHECDSMLDRHVQPFQTCYVRIQIFHCLDASGFSEKQSTSRQLNFA